MNNYYLPFGLRILDPKVEVIKQCVYKDFDINIEINSITDLCIFSILRSISCASIIK